MEMFIPTICFVDLGDGLLLFQPHLDRCLLCLMIRQWRTSHFLTLTAGVPRVVTTGGMDQQVSVAGVVPWLEISSGLSWRCPKKTGKWERIVLPTSWTGNFYAVVLCCVQIQGDVMGVSKKWNEYSTVHRLIVSLFHAFQMNQKNTVLICFAIWSPCWWNSQLVRSNQALVSNISPIYLSQCCRFYAHHLLSAYFCCWTPHSSSSNSFDPHFSPWIHPLLVKFSPGWWWLEHLYFSISW